MAETLVERIHALARKCAEQDAMLKSLIAEVNVESLEKPYTAYKADPASIELNKLQDGALVITDSPATTNFRLPNVGEIVTSLTPLNDPALHLLDGAKLSLDGMYREGLLKIIALQSTHPNLFVTESAWQASIAAYNVCGKFVYDNVARTVRLPLVTGFIEGTIDSSILGDLVEAGLSEMSGSTIAGPVIKGFIYIVLTNTISTPVVADIQREVDSKVNAEEAAHAAMPSGQYIEMTLPATGETVTAPADGWLYLEGTTPSGSTNATFKSVYLQKGTDYGVSSGTWPSLNMAQVMLPVNAGDIIVVRYSPIGATSFSSVSLRFYYANSYAPTN